MTLKVSSARFGGLEIEDAKVIAIPDGMVGFDEQRFVLLNPAGGGPFCWFQAVDNPDLAFVVVDPTQFVPEYRIKITRDEYDRLLLGPDDEMILLAVVTMAPDPRNITINLQGPIALNPARMIAKQLVMDEKYPSRHPLFPADAAGVVPAAASALRKDLGTVLSSIS
jgi:flagellar assembly factor FliW